MTTQPDSPARAESKAGLPNPPPTSLPRANSPIRWLLLRAVIWTVAFAVAHVFGLRSYTSVLSGIAPFGSAACWGGVVYLVLYGGLVIGVPILVIAAGLIHAWDRVTARRPAV